MSRIVGRAAAIALAIMLWAPGPAEAEWLKATSRHFIVYSDTSDAALCRQAGDLEHFYAIIRRFHAKGDSEDATFNRVTVYVVPTVSAVERLYGGRNIAGFYKPRVTGSVAFIPREGGDGRINELSPKIVLFHEYAHHFLLGNYTVAYPAWFAEGYAEFASTVTERDGAYWLGSAANHRAYSLLLGAKLPIRKLFEPPAKMTPEQIGALYARGWLLTHYLLLDADRSKQLTRYIDLFNNGRTSLDAATEAFGDLNKLDHALDVYLHKSTMPAVRIDPAVLTSPAIDIRPLTAGERALITLRIASTRGVDGKTAPPLYAKAAVAAVPFPTDAVAQGWLAEMATDAHQYDAAVKAADAAIAADPTSSQGLLYKARLHLYRAVEAKTADPKVWAEARSWIVKANRAQPDDAAALALFYQAYLMQKAPPGRNAIAALYRAVELVPQDSDMRFLAARQLIIDNETDRARRMLRPLAFDPHAGADNPATRLLAQLDAGKSGQAAIDAVEQTAADQAATD